MVSPAPTSPISGARSKPSAEKPGPAEPMRMASLSGRATHAEALATRLGTTLS